jgi:hypothetical protein
MRWRWVVPGAGVAAVEEGINSYPYQKLTQVVQPTAVQTKIMVSITLRPHNPSGLGWVGPNAEENVLIRAWNSVPPVASYPIALVSQKPNSQCHYSKLHRRHLKSGTLWPDTTRNWTQV